MLIVTLSLSLPAKRSVAQDRDARDAPKLQYLLILRSLTFSLSAARFISHVTS